MNQIFYIGNSVVYTIDIELSKFNVLFNPVRQIEKMAGVKSVSVIVN